MWGWGGGGNANKQAKPAQGRKSSWGGAEAQPNAQAAPPSQPVQVPVSRAGATSSANKWGAGISPKSVAAMDKLETLSGQLDDLEAQVLVIKAVLDNDAVTRSQVLEAKDDIAQVNGTLERIQYAGVDSIVTAELDTGREMAKKTRKSMNMRCDDLRERVLELSVDGLESGVPEAGDASSHYLVNMPIYRLLVRAELENIESLSAVPDNQWCIDVACGSERKDGVFVSSAESQEVEGSRGTAHLVLKFPGTNKQSTISIVDPAKCATYTEEDSGKFKVVLTLECRGVEVVGWKPTTDFNVTSTGGAKFEAVDLSEGDWSEYDGDADLPVSITEVATKVESGK